ncbi:MAG: SMI1/KNR4 family protein [Candidatus Riflebacteria bacterium]|nr:SMI1/KNR4 family protein [Candidatus Riflebacteria bacterium]
MNDWAGRWERLRTLVDRVRPGANLGLRLGASDALLDQACARLSQELPREILDCYRVHDGQTCDADVGLLFGWRFLSLDAMCSCWDSWLGLEFEFPPDDFVSTGPVREQYACPGWIPISDDGSGNHVGLDLDPAAGGTPGQIIPFGRDFQTKAVLAATLSELFDRFVCDLESGAVRLDELGRFSPEPAPLRASGFLSGGLSRWRKIMREELRAAVREHRLREAEAVAAEAVGLAVRLFPAGHFNLENTLEMQRLIAMRHGRGEGAEPE